MQKLKKIKFILSYFWDSKKLHVLIKNVFKCYLVLSCRAFWINLGFGETAHLPLP